MVELCAKLPSGIQVTFVHNQQRAAISDSTITGAVNSQVAAWSQQQLRILETKI
jgi:hypothetical protein